jgi:hypothetical protein
MKIFTYILLAIASALIIFNVTLIDFQNPLEGDSFIAIVGILAALCAIFILLIFRMSKKITDKLKG